MIRAVVFRGPCSWVRRRQLGACRHVGMVARASPAWFRRRGRHGSCLWWRAMLRITTTIRPDGSTVGLEGRLAGPWVDELRACWRSLAATGDARAIRIDLDAVTFIDTAGKALLWAMHEQGAVLTATGCMTRAILEEIGRNARERGGRTTAENGGD